MISNLSANKNIINISVVDRNGIIMVDSNPGKIGKHYNDRLTKKILLSEKSTTLYDYEDKSKVLLLIMPLHGKNYLANLHTNVVGLIYLKVTTAYLYPLHFKMRNLVAQIRVRFQRIFPKKSEE